MKKIFAVLVVVGITFGICSCTEKKIDDLLVNSESSEKNSVQQKPINSENEKQIEDFSKSTAENDTDLGLKNIKIDSAQGDLTEKQKLIIRYFSGDYMFVNSIEALQRYNDIFQDALIESYVKVAKVISYEGNAFELLVYIVESSEEYYHGGYADVTRLMIIRGETQNGRFIVDDGLRIRGRFEGVQNVEVDGVSLYVPVIDIHEGNLLIDESYSFYPSRFTMKEVKEIAKCIFGENITISEPDPLVDEVDSTEPYYVCTLDNQSNAKFSKYYFHERLGLLEDANDSVSKPIEIEFAADFQHFFLIMYDRNVETLTLEYYDNNLNKIWKREFEDIVVPMLGSVATYDFTKNNVYLCANNTLYIINIETGEDSYESTFIGEKIDIRKFSDGILTISSAKSDAFVYTNIRGEIVWTIDAVCDISRISAVQEVDGKLVIKVINDDKQEYNPYTGELVGSYEYYYVIDMETGDMVYQGQVDSVQFHQYS